MAIARQMAPRTIAAARRSIWRVPDFASVDKKPSLNKNRPQRAMFEDTLILCYHAISEKLPADLSVHPSAFEDQIRRKLRSGYRGATLSESQMLERTGKTLVVTFDDGYLSTLAVAAPVLDRLGVPATLFVPTDYIGQDGPLSWPGIEQWSSGVHREELKPLDWEGVRQLAAEGWEIGSHTCRHPRLTKLPLRALEHELQASRTAIELRVNRPCRSVAYPYGDVDETVANAARTAGYEFGVGLPAKWTDESDPMQLPRVGVYRGQGRTILRVKTSPLVRRLRLLTGC